MQPVEGCPDCDDWRNEAVWLKANPNKAAFNAGIAYARGPVPVPGFVSVLSNFDTGLENMAAGTATPEQVLQNLQRDGDQALKGA